jgi:hypothetical protein
MGTQRLPEVMQIDDAYLDMPLLSNDPYSPLRAQTCVIITQFPKLSIFLTKSQNGMDHSEFRSSADKFAPANNSRSRPHNLFGVVPLIQSFTLLFTTWNSESPFVPFAKSPNIVRLSCSISP